MSTKDKILKSIHPVIENSNLVKVNQDKIKEFAKSLLNSPIPPWNNELQLKTNQEETIQYYFFLDSINFCFWPTKGNEKWSYKNNHHWLSGYYAYSYALKNAVKNDPKLLNSDYLLNIPYEKFTKIFKGKGELQLLEERHNIITDNFKILSKKFDGQASKLVNLANKDVNILIELLLQNFPSFRDISSYNNNEVFLLKRCQIFISDIHYSLENKNLGNFINIDDLTIFADYKLPQLLQFVGIINYSENILEKIKNNFLIKHNSMEELEIRANTIHACNLLVEEMKKLGRNINNNQLDWILWVKAKQTNFSLPHHKTITIFY